MSHKIKYLVCYDMDATLSKKSIDIINVFNIKINPNWVMLEYDKDLEGNDSGINYWQLKDNGEPCNGYFRTLNSDPLWILPFLDGMPFEDHIEYIYDIYTEEEYDIFKKTLDPYPQDL